MKIRPVGAELFHASTAARTDGRTDRQTDRWTSTMNLTVAFRKFCDCAKYKRVLLYTTYEYV